MSSDERHGVRVEQMLIAAIATTAAIGLGIATQTRRTAALDRTVRSAVRARRPQIVRLAKAASFPAAPQAHTAVAVASVATIHAATGRFAAAPVIASLLAFGIDRASRLFVDQLRPPFAGKRSGLDRFGFPSGHTSAATAIAFATAMEVARGGAPATKAAAYVMAGLYSAAVGWSRVALDEHWADDVLGGWAIGVGIASIAVTACDVVDAGW